MDLAACDRQRYEGGILVCLFGFGPFLSLFVGVRYWCGGLDFCCLSKVGIGLGRDLEELFANMVDDACCAGVR